MAGGPAPYRRRDAAERAVETVAALELKVGGASYREIGVALGLSTSQAYRRVNEALSEVMQPKVDQLRHLEAQRLDELNRHAHRVLNADHVLVQHGKIVLDKDGNTVVDQDLKLRAITVITRLSDSRRKLLGLDAPTQIEATIHPADPLDMELQKIVRAAQAKNAAIEAKLKGGPQWPAQTEGELT